MQTAKASFGVEVEFFIVDTDGYPVLQSSMEVINHALANYPNLNLETELSSFQIELNPGPWDLTLKGLDDGIAEIKKQISVLNKAVTELGLILCKSPMPPNINNKIINSQEFFTVGERYKASSDYFKNRYAVLEFDGNTDNIILPGETAVGCLNEIHINIQLNNDAQTIALFNYLNKNSEMILDKFRRRIEINGNFLSSTCNTMSLFESANSEWNTPKTIKRVAYVPGEIGSHDEYIQIINTFKKIPIDKQFNKYLDLESTVYFWVRLRGEPGNLRVEYRPFDMNTNWDANITYLIKLCLQDINTKIHKHQGQEVDQHA